MEPSVTATAATNSQAAASRPRIAVAIPCFNEAPAIGTVIASVPYRSAGRGDRGLRQQLDRRHGECRAAAGRAGGSRGRAGQGIRRARSVCAAGRPGRRRSLWTATGPTPPRPHRCWSLPVLDEAADMVVGARQPEAGAGAMSPVRGLGNLLIRSAFRALDRQGNRRSALGLPGLLPEVSADRIAALRGLRDRDRAGHRGRDSGSCQHSRFPSLTVRASPARSASCAPSGTAGESSRRSSCTACAATRRG